MHTATNQSSSLASALLCVQQALQPAAKDGKNPYHATRYATLNSVMASCRELLISHGILQCHYLRKALCPVRHIGHHYRR